jgi:hypothetical protein
MEVMRMINKQIAISLDYNWLPGDRLRYRTMVIVQHARITGNVRSYRPKIPLVSEPSAVTVRNTFPISISLVGC